MKTLLKFIRTDSNRGTYVAFNYTDYLPKGDKPGKWLPKVKRPEHCRRGYHVTTAEDLLVWAKEGCSLYVVESRGEATPYYEQKSAHSQIRLVRLVAGWNQHNLYAAAIEGWETVVLKALLDIRKRDAQFTDFVKAKALPKLMQLKDLLSYEVERSRLAMEPPQVGYKTVMLNIATRVAISVKAETSKQKGLVGERAEDILRLSNSLFQIVGTRPLESFLSVQVSAGRLHRPTGARMRHTLRLQEAAELKVKDILLSKLDLPKG